MKRRKNDMQEIAYDMTYTDLNPRFLFSCIHSKKEADPVHSHDFIELAIVLRGQGRVLIDDREYDVEEGNVVLLNPGTRHCSRPDPETGLFPQVCFLGFTDVEFRNCPPGYMPLFKDYQRITKLPEGLMSELSHLCTAIDHEANTCEVGRYFMLKAYLIQVICLLGRFQKQEYEKEQKKELAAGCEFKSINKKYIVRKITEYMEDHYQEKISLDQIAANMYLSSYYVSKLFKSETGDTPINYLISLRMKKARELLDTQPDSPIQAVAAAVGYEDAYHFSKLFKKYYGLSPLYYKARIPQ